MRELPYTYKDLNNKEENIFDAFQLFLDTSFSDGNSCLTLSQLKEFPFAEGFSKNGYLMSTNYDELVKNIDRITYITLGKDIYHKTSKLLYFMSKYRGDMNIRELNNLSVKEIVKIIYEELEKSFEMDNGAYTWLKN